MEDEVLRLQQEWAAVLQEIQRASEENLILKDILMLSFSFPTCNQDGSRTEPLLGSTGQTQDVETANVDPKDRFRSMVDHSKLPTSTGTDTTSPSSHTLAQVLTECTRYEHSEAFDFFPNTSTLHPDGDKRPQVLGGLAEEVDESRFSSFTTLSHSPTHKLITGQCTDLEPSANANECIFSAEEPCLGNGHDLVHPVGSPEYYNISGLTPLGDEPSRTRSLISSNNSNNEPMNLFKLEADVPDYAYANTSMLNRLEF